MAKSRIVILGFKDPHVLQLERSAPTPTNEGFTLVMQTMASLGFEAVSADIKNAFGQSMPTNRQQPICSSLPNGMIESGFDLDPRQLILCNTEVYGLISGPSWLRQSLMSFFLNKGYVRNHYEKCALSLPPSWAAKTKGAIPYNEGVILVEVDDILEGGNARHRALMEEFYSKFKCGKRKRLIDLGDEGTLIGRTPVYG